MVLRPLNTSAVHMSDKKNVKNGLFFETECDSLRGKKVPVFEEKWSFLNSIRGTLEKILFKGENWMQNHLKLIV